VPIAMQPHFSKGSHDASNSGVLINDQAVKEEETTSNTFG